LIWSREREVFYTHERTKAMKDFDDVTTMRRKNSLATSAFFLNKEYQSEEEKRRIK